MRRLSVLGMRGLAFTLAALLLLPRPARGQEPPRSPMMQSITLGPDIIQQNIQNKQRQQQLDMEKQKLDMAQHTAKLSDIIEAATPAAGDAMAESLRGVKNFAVLVERLDEEALTLGLSEADLQTSVELKLRLAAIAIVNVADARRSLGTPALYVRVTSVGKAPGIMSFIVDLSFQQRVVLERDSSRSLLAATWSRTRMSVGGSNGGVDFVKRSIASLTDDFLNDYLSVNPK